LQYFGLCITWKWNPEIGGRSFSETSANTTHLDTIPPFDKTELVSKLNLRERFKYV
jgi:hypothetical protein